MKKSTIMLALALLAMAVIISVTRAVSPSVPPADNDSKPAVAMVGQEESTARDSVAPDAAREREELRATADATVDAITPDFPYGGQPGLHVGYNHTTDFQQSRALMRFDLSTIPDNTVINSARLEVYVNGATGTGEVAIDIARMTEDWDEETVTWNNGHQDTIAPLAPPVTEIVGLATGVWVDWVVTELVQDWLDGEFPNHGLVLYGPEWQIEYARTFASREAADGSRAPRLIVNYGEPEPGPDLSVAAVEVTQGIQCLDDSRGAVDCDDNDVPLVEGRPTFVRVFVDTGAADTNIDNVNARLRRLVDNLEVYVDAYNGPISARPVPNREFTDHSLNFLLPREWWSDHYLFIVEVDPDNQIDEPNEVNNATVQEAAFNARKSLTITYSPLAYDPEADGNPIWPSNRIDTAYRWLYNTFPLAEYPTYVEEQTYIVQYDVDVDNNKARLINFLYNLWAQNEHHDSSVTKQIYAGWLPDGSYFYHGLSDPMWGGGTGIPVFANDDPDMYGRTLAHEIAHNFNRRHVVDDDNWPYETDQIHETGFDIDTRGAVSEARADLMVGGLREDEAWISPYTYEALYEWFGAPLLPEQNPDRVQPYVVTERALITGFIRRNGTGELNALYRFQAPEPAAATPPGTDFCVRFLTSAGFQLAQRCFNVSFAALDSEQPRSAAPFGMLEPWPAKTAQVQLTKATTVLDRLYVSINPPAVQIEQPNGGEIWDGTEVIKWQGSDPDGDPLTYAVLYSADNGHSWHALATMLEATELEVNTDLLPGSERALIRVRATDGARTAEDLSDATFSVVRKSPTATIMMPGHGDRFDAGYPVLIRGVAYDREDGRLEDSRLNWYSDRDGRLGSGGTLVKTTLSAGHHRLTFEVRDMDDNVARDLIEIDIAGDVADKQRSYLPLLLKSR